MKVIISAGGTGGHIYPALAIINKIKKEDKSADFLYIGTTTRMEKDLIPKYGIKYEGIETYGISRKFSLSNFKSIVKFIKAISTCKKIIKSYRPDIVIGCGGYVTAPVIYAAKKCKVKTLVHEQNSILGLSNKMMLKYTDTLCTSFKEMNSDKTNVVYTGNPQGDSVYVMKGIPKKDFGLSSGKKLVLIVMGSLGSKTVNNVLKESLTKFDSSYEVLIVTGKDYYEQFKKLKRNDNVFIEPYIDGLNRLFSNVDVLVTRAGATTISELIGTCTPAIFVPSPYVTENHQYKNAMSLVNDGAAKILEEKDLSSESLINEINKLINDDKEIKNIKSNLKKMQIKDASGKIYNEIKKLVGKNEYR